MPHHHTAVLSVLEVYVYLSDFSLSGKMFQKTTVIELGVILFQYMYKQFPNDTGNSSQYLLYRVILISSYLLQKLHPYR